MVYLLDPMSGTAMSQDHQFLAQAIAERYPEFRLAQVPMCDRSATEEFPFAITQNMTGAVVKELRENECNVRFIFEWLYMHDTQRRGNDIVYKEYIDKKARKAQAEADKKKDQLMENLDIVHSMANHQKHTYKHGDRKFG